MKNKLRECVRALYAERSNAQSVTKGISLGRTTKRVRSMANDLIRPNGAAAAETNQRNARDVRCLKYVRNWKRSALLCREHASIVE